MWCLLITARLLSNACDKVETMDAHLPVQRAEVSLSLCSVESPPLFEGWGEPGAFSASLSQR